MILKTESIILKGMMNIRFSMIIYYKFEKGEEMSIVNILEFLKKWLIDHILHQDLLLGRYLNQIKAVPVADK